MTAPMPERIRINWLLPLFMLIVGLLAGYYIGRTMALRVKALGNCYNRDTALVASGVSESECTGPCSSCSWEQNK